MRSIQLAAHRVDHSSPTLNQWSQLQRFAFVKIGNLRELGKLPLHQRKVGDWPQSCSRHIGVAVQGLSAENDAAVGFGWCHDENMPCLC